MPTGGLSLREREARAFDTRARAATASLGVLLLGAWFPGLLQLASAAGKRGRVHRLKDDDEPAMPGPVRVSHALADPTVYHLVNIKTGARDSATRTQMRERHGINSACACELIKGRAKTAKGWRLCRPAEQDMNG